MTAEGADEDTPTFLQPSTMASRKRDRDVTGRPARRASAINRLDYTQPFTLPARVPVKDRTDSRTITVNDQEDQ